MDSGTVLAIAIPALVVLAGVGVLTTASRRDRRTAVGDLSRETRKRDRSQAPATVVPEGAAERPTGREVELAAKLEREGRAVVLAPPPAPPAPVGPLDPEALGVTRRQFLNRGSIGLMGLSLSGFGAACVAFLWPEAAGGFGAKITLPDSLDKILGQIRAERKPYYFAKGRVYLTPYPQEALAKAKNVYDPSVLAGMEAGIVALYQKCVHLGCRVPWCTTAQWFECPCHGSRYNRVGEKKGGPAPRGLDRFPVEVKSGRVTVDTGIIIQGPPIGTNTTGQEAEGPHCVTAE